jgi:predicted nucleic acid-binding protein
VLIELFKHKEKIVRLSHLAEDDVLLVLHSLLRRLRIYKEDLITPESLRAAFDLCSRVDEDDTPHVALTIELGGLLWTGDKRLREGLRARGFDRFFVPTP